MFPEQSETIAVVGLGYVGLPLAVEFGRKRRVIGFDLDTDRISKLRAGIDSNMETSADELTAADSLVLTSDPSDLSAASTYIVTVPTPIDSAKRPDLRPLVSASELVGAALSSGDTVIFESTVYPGATEEVCVPILEEVSGLEYNVGFTVGYSPERINPGDREHRLPSILKVTSGSTPAAAERIDALYQEIISAGTYRAASIRVAEAAKVIENTQRDVNIALINELAVLFGELGIDTHEVLEAAGTKWNFLPFKPGLVGGHCIGVDPYYLTHKAQEVGHHPEVILVGRRLNDSMGQYVADRIVLLMAQKGAGIGSARVLILGLAFKENCPDIRNTRVVDIISRLESYGMAVDVVDPWVSPETARTTHRVNLLSLDQALTNSYDAVALAVPHAEFVALKDSVRELFKTAVIYDIKGAWPRDSVDGRL